MTVGFFPFVHHHAAVETPNCGDAKIKRLHACNGPHCKRFL
jgi:predicted RNA-binding Zn-ribbon protein involved in translation (DUF1610 family)